ncbi:MAG: hypothetical protein KDE51_15360 [Anaerolineales bacterium]|nr:hypothetical protein [Anaerolineales bacterium]
MKRPFLIFYFSPILLLFITLLVGNYLNIENVAANYSERAEQTIFLPIIREDSPSSDGLWQPVNEGLLEKHALQRHIIPEQYRTVAVNGDRLAAILAEAPLEFSSAAADETVQMSLPLPDGRYLQVKLFESPIMAPELATRYPQITTYIGQGVEDPTASARLDWTPKGFHAQIFLADEVVYIDPYSRADTTHYISYYKRFLTSSEPFIEPDLSNVAESLHTDEQNVSSAVTTGDELRVYRLAMAATGEYTAFHGGTVADALAAIVTTMNRVNGIYEREVAVRMVLVANTDDVIYTNAGSDPYTNGDTSAMVTENQTTLDAEIGNGNYDMVLPRIL